MFKIRIVENKSKEISEAIDYEKANLEKELNQILALQQKEPEKFEDDHVGALQDTWLRLVGADGDKERKEKEDLKKELNNFKEFYKLDSPDNQQQATPDEGPDTFPHPLNPGQKLNKLDYWLTTIAIPKVTGVRVPRIGNLKNHNPFKNPPADTAIEKLVDTLSASLNEGPEDRREDDESDDGKGNRKEKKKSAGSVLQMLQQADPGNKGLHKVYRWLTDTLVSTMREKAYALSKRIQNLNKSGQTDIEYVEPWRSPTVTEELGGNAYIDEKFKSELQFVTDYVASKLAVAINQGKLDYGQLLGVEEPGEDPAGEEPGGAEEPGAEEPGGGKSDKPINVVKGKHSLQVQLTNKFGSNNKGANKFLAAIARDIKDQLATNGINVQESIQEILSVISSDLLLTERQYEEISKHPKLKNIIKNLDIKNGTVSDQIKGKDYPDLKGTENWKKPFYIAVNKDGEARVYSADEQGRGQAGKWTESGEANLDDIEPTDDMPEEPKEEQNYEENIEEIEKSEYAKKLDDLVKKKINNAKIKDKDFAMEALQDVLIWSVSLAKKVFGKDGNDKVISQSGMTIEKLPREIGKVIGRFEDNDKPGHNITDIPRIGDINLRDKIFKIMRTHYGENQRIEKEKGNKTKGALARKRADQSYKDARGDEKEKVDYIKKAMSPSSSNKGSINIGKAVGQKLKAAMMAISDPAKRKEFEKLVDKEKLLKAVRKFVDYAIKSSGKQDKVKMLGEERDRKDLQTILENKKPTSYKIKIIKANA
ncbi:MAG TPA: hypothetical protein EYG21_03000 [Nitrospinaceae bacterium]|nr:hypothetical protein [Nitrospinaceae bacterium]